MKLKEASRSMATGMMDVSFYVKTVQEFIQELTCVDEEVIRIYN